MSESHTADPATPQAEPVPTRPLPFHRLRRARPGQWWRPVLLVLLAWPVVQAVLYLTALVDGLLPADGLPILGGNTDLAVLLVGIATLFPVTLAAVRWVEQRPPGTVLSVTGRLRWSWLGSCLLRAAIIQTALVVVEILLDTRAAPTEAVADPPGGGVGISVAMIVGTSLIMAGIIAVQSLAEEALCRGLVLQSVGGFFTSAWPGILAQAVLFTVLHGTGTPFGTVDLLIYSAMFGWFTVRTAGIEAALAWHFATNLSVTILDLMNGQTHMSTTATVADISWQAAMVHLGSTALYISILPATAPGNPTTRK